MRKSSSNQENIIIINIQVPNIGTPNCIKQILINLKRKIDNNSMIVRDFNTLLSTIKVIQSSRQVINKETLNLNCTLDQMYLIEKYRSFHPRTTEYTSFSNAHRTFFTLDHVLGHSSLSIFKKIKFKSFGFKKDTKYLS